MHYSFTIDGSTIPETKNKAKTDLFTKLEESLHTLERPRYESIEAGFTPSVTSLATLIRLGSTNITEPEALRLLGYANRIEAVRINSHLNRSTRPVAQINEAKAILQEHQNNKEQVDSDSTASLRLGGM